MIKDEFKSAVKEYNGESCSWCKNGDKHCEYRRRAMEATREVVKGISCCTFAYCSLKVSCDYYVKDDERYMKYNIGECQR